jgi:hypothetical protein
LLKNLGLGGHAASLTCCCTDRDLRVEGQELGDLDHGLRLTRTQPERLQREQHVALELDEELVTQRCVGVGPVAGGECLGEGPQHRWRRRAQLGLLAEDLGDRDVLHRSWRASFVEVPLPARFAAQVAAEAVRAALAGGAVSPGHLDRHLPRAEARGVFRGRGRGQRLGAFGAVGHARDHL